MCNFASLCAASLLIVCASSSGCSTANRLLRFRDGAQVYGGTRSHVYPGQELFNTLHEERDSSFQLLMQPFVAMVWTIDLVCSFAADTACLPLTIPGDTWLNRNPRAVAMSMASPTDHCRVPAPFGGLSDETARRLPEVSR